MSTGNPFWDMMLSFGKASRQALSGYEEDRAARRAAGDVEVIPVGEETLNVGTRTVQGETTRVRRVVVETPVEQEVTLREERVIVERRKPTAATATAVQGILGETAVEMTDTYEVVEAWKSVRVVEEFVLRREVTERRETVHDTVRRDEVTVEQAPRTLRAPRHGAEAARQPAAELPEARAASLHAGTAAPQDVAPHVLRPEADAVRQEQGKELIIPPGALDEANVPPRTGQDKGGFARKQ